MEEGSAGEFPIGDDIIGEAATGVPDGAAQEPAGGVVLAIPGAVRFDIQGQGQAGSHHTDEDQPVVVAEDFPLLIPVRTAEVTNLFAGSSSAGSIQGQADEAAVVEGLVALGLTHGGDGRPPGHRRVEPLGEIAQRIIAEALGNVQGAASLRTHQRFNPGEGRAAQQHPHQQSPQQGRSGDAPLPAAIAREAQEGLQTQTSRHILLEATRRRPSHRRFCLRHRASNCALAAKTSATASLNS